MSITRDTLQKKEKKAQDGTICGVRGTYCFSRSKACSSVRDDRLVVDCSICLGRSIGRSPLLSTSSVSSDAGVSAAST
eukprot:m.172937 g.172937  ORF g.172937 m.172937 type:complete len:78 (-) comp16522_c0_seq1:416-649(-)